MARQSPVVRATKRPTKNLSDTVKRTSDIPVQKIGQGIQGNRHDVKSGSGMGIK